MDRNCERNLQKAELLRVKGDLARARRKLAEWVQEHPDTPPYRIELARACLDLGDAHAGLTELRALLRQYPDLHPDALAVVTDHFRATANLPCAQFLFEDHLARGEHEEAALILEPLAEAQLRQALERYATKLASLDTHRELAIGGDGGSRRLALWGSFHFALALKDFDGAAAHGTQLVRADEGARGALLALLDRRARTQQTPPRLLALLGEARAREGRTLEGLSALLAAAERDRELIGAVEEIVAEITPLLTDATALLRTRGHLARLAGRHEEAVIRYREAVARDPQGTASLIELLSPAAEADGPEARPYALLRLELLARAGDGPALGAALEHLRTRPWLDAAELKTVLASHLEESATPSVTANAALLAIATDDAENLDRLLAGGPALGQTRITPLARAIELRLGLPPVQAELVSDPITGELTIAAATTTVPGAMASTADLRRWLPALVRLHVATGDAAGVNARLPLLWSISDDLTDEPWRELCDLTRTAFAAVTPAATSLIALIGPLARRGDGELLRPWLAAATALEPTELEELAEALVTAAITDPDQARVLREALAGPEINAVRYVLPRAAARLFAGDEAGGLHDLATLATTRPDLETRTLDLLLTHARLHPGRGDVALAAARLLRVDDRLDEAMALLGPVFERDAARVEEVGLFFESLLAAEPERAEIWMPYLEGLAAAGRFRRLSELLPRAEQTLPAARIGHLRAFRARLLCEEGNPADALTECELALQLADPPLAVLADLLRAVLAADPGLARAHKLLGDVLGAAGDLQEALRAHGRALRCDPARQTEVLHSVRRLAGRRLLGAAECLALARFYLEAGRGDDASAAYLESLQIESGTAAEVASDLGDAGNGDAPFPSLLQPLARAWRLLGQVEPAATVCTTLYAFDTSRADWIFRELSLLEAAHPEVLAPVRARAHILLAEHRADDVPRLLEAALRRLRDPGAKRQLAREFAPHLSARLRAEAESSDNAVPPAASTPPAAPAAAAPTPQEEVKPDLGTAVAEPAPETPVDPVAREQAEYVAEAQRQAVADHPLEAIRWLRRVPLSGSDCRLDLVTQARALWLLAHAEESRGGWAAACACYRELGGLTDEADRARRALNRCYGRLLQQTVADEPLVLEKIAILT
jgi:tetratricopeptide (TPR) repeat protein